MYKTLGCRGGAVCERQSWRQGAGGHGRQRALWLRGRLRGGRPAGGGLLHMQEGAPCPRCGAALCSRRVFVCSACAPFLSLRQGKTGWVGRCGADPPRPPWSSHHTSQPHPHASLSPPCLSVSAQWLCWCVCGGDGLSSVSPPLCLSCHPPRRAGVCGTASGFPWWPSQRQALCPGSREPLSASVGGF